ncbi:bifunctional 4-hydroxy-3-methylbut-2-enyl diphosphate reductase/30S ribosomal protein S1 [Anoxybacter fermentans]|uniref:bifunctional 4-hydroxy-3-methylbut-2-enyl diphosphate reductase/30S ribosomal protein S1 n=1 Tax=Anoxybacter fermentans TaxID=1323375 RepID=UPI000F8E6694|nr:bifunctional 4-hydroxy-3-methylbut-2-enyl diphosphate reductase/30S ribosomal protein S1 [Anoxybacter fermentans]
MVLEIILADHAGFCFGVKRATDLAISLAKDPEKPLYTLGPLIHNPQVVQRLEDLGIRAIDRVQDVEDGIIIIRSHGVPPRVIDEIKARGLEVIDATCPFVRRAQEYAKQLAEDGYQVIICGDQNHPEVIGIRGSVNSEVLVAKTLDELPQHKLKRKVGVIAQTTLSIQNFKNLISQLVERVDELKVFNTICTTTEERQKAASNLAKKVDLMLVIGGRNSANTNRLVEICRNEGVTTYHIETADELKKEWFENVQRVGVTAGASTPNWIIKEVLSVMSEFNEEKKVVLTEEGKHETEEVKKENEEIMLDHSIRDLKIGEKIKGTVVEVKDDSVFVSIGHKSEGVIPLNELTFRPVKSAHEVVKEGDEIDVVVIGLEDEEGNIRLSRKRAVREQAWERIMDAYENGEVIEAEVTRVVKGGLVVDVGLRGFVPASHVAIEYVEDLEQFVGQTLRFKVIEVDRANNNVVLSRKIVLEEEREALKAETLSKLEEGQIVEGKVTKIVDFGAFVDLGGIEGLLHISEISWGRIDHPSEVLKEGETIRVKVLKLDKENERIALGIKQTQPDPWVEFAKKHHVGEVVSGTITKTVDFGAFMEIEPGVEGLIHISQLARRHVETPTEVVNVGDKIEAKIININIDERKVGLSLKELEPAPAPKPKEDKSKKESQTYFTAPQESSGFSIGEMVGDILENAK